MDTEVLVFLDVQTGMVIQSTKNYQVALTLRAMFDQSFWRLHPTVPNRPFGIWAYDGNGGGWLWTGHNWLKLALTRSGSLINSESVE